MKKSSDYRAVIHSFLVRAGILLLPIFFWCSLLQVPFCRAEPAIIYVGEVEGNTYSQLLRSGMQEFEKSSGTGFIEIETPIDVSGYVPALLDSVRQKYSPVILPYSDKFSDISEIIDKNQDIKFILLDHGDVDKPNVFAFSFADHEGSFMAGALAAMMTKSKVVGFIYVSDTYDVLQRFRSGYLQGCQAADPEVKVLQTSLGDYPGVWGDQAKAGRLAEEMIAKGADVLFAAAGLAGKGVLAKAAEKNIYAIGVDGNQNDLYPGTMIGSMVKRVDKAVFAALKLSSAGINRDGLKRLGIAQEAVGIDFAGVKKGLVPEEVRKRLYELRMEISSGKRKVKEQL